MVNHHNKWSIFIWETIDTIESLKNYMFILLFYYNFVKEMMIMQN